MDRRSREEIEVAGVPYAVATIVESWEDVSINNVEMITEKQEQYKGIDYTIKFGGDVVAKIDSKYHLHKSRKQKYTEHGVDVLSIEITKAGGLAGWGINEDLETDYILDIINGVGWYVIDAHKLREFMANNYKTYLVMYASEGREDYRAVSVKDLIANNIIIYFGSWVVIEDKAEEYKNGFDKEYNTRIKPLINGLITGR